MTTIFEGFEKSTANVTAPGIKIGIIGGTGLENSEFMLTSERVAVTTPYGEPSGLEFAINY